VNFKATRGAQNVSGGLRHWRSTARAMVVTLSILAASPVWAARPLTTEDTGTLDPGAAELELGADYIVDRRADVQIAAVVPTLNIGLLPRLEGSIAAPFVVVGEHSESWHAGIGDTFIRIKYRLLDEGTHVPAVMAAVTVRLPTGDRDRGLGDDGVDVQPLAVVSKSLGPVTLTANAGYTFIERGREFDFVNVNASAEAAITEQWAIVAEVVSDLATGRRADDRLVLRAGTIYAVGQRLKFDAAAGLGVTRNTPDFLLTVGLTLRLF
jgi:Putative MetA-pathway of phenol degradation